MKTKEFINKVEALGFQTNVNGREIKVCDEMRGYGVTEPMFVLTSDLADIYVPGEFYISSPERLSVLKLIVEYLDTPNSEREEEKRYYLQLSVSLLKDNEFYLQRIKSKGTYTVGSHIVNKNFDVIFTKSEIAQMDITGFEKIEVSEC